MNIDAFDAFLSFLEQHDRFLILIHEKPDGDAIGSSHALALFLKAIGKDCAVACPSPFPHRLSFLCSDDVPYFTPDTVKNYPYETVISVDAASPSQLAGLWEDLRLPLAYAVDHHKTNSLSPTVGKYVDPSAAAVGEILFDMMERYAAVHGTPVISPAVADALFTAVSSDSGCFRYGNTTAHTHAVAASLFAVGVHAEQINRILFDTKSLVQMKTEAAALDKLTLYFDGRLAIVCLTLDDLAAIGATEEDTETLSQIARTVEGVEIGVLMREKKQSDGSSCFKYSVRSNSDADVSLLCAAFGGGGHKKAAGCTIAADKETALSRFLTEAEKLLNV